MSVRSERARRREEREARFAVVTEEVKRQNDCANGRHRYGKKSLVFKGQRMCRCGAVEGEMPN